MSYRDRVDPEIAAVIDAIEPLDLTDIEGTRASRLELWRAARSRIPDLPTVTKEDSWVQRDGAPALLVRVYRRTPAAPATPAAERSPGLLWIHGGGYVLGSTEQDDLLCQRLADELELVVVSVEWRRAPEHAFPAAIDDCSDALRWLHDNAARLGVDAARLAVGGASSGAGAAAAVALRARDEGGPSLAYQLLMYPMLDDRNDSPSALSVTDEKFWNHQTNALAWSLYLGPDHGEVSAYAAPARAGDLGGLPPAFIAVGELDMFLDEDVEYAVRLMHAGVPVDLRVYPGAPHAFDMLAPNATVSRRAARDRNEGVRRALFPAAQEPAVAG